MYPQKNQWQLSPDPPGLKGDTAHYGCRTHERALPPYIIGQRAESKARRRQSEELPTRTTDISTRQPIEERWCTLQGKKQRRTAGARTHMTKTSHTIRPQNKQKHGCHHVTTGTGPGVLTVQRTQHTKPTNGQKPTRTQTTIVRRNAGEAPHLPAAYRLLATTAPITSSPAAAPPHTRCGTQNKQHCTPPKPKLETGPNTHSRTHSPTQQHDTAASDRRTQPHIHTHPNPRVQ